MSTRVKLIILVIFTSLAGASSLFINNSMMRPVQNIKNEQKLFENLSYRFMDYIAQVNRLDSELFDDQVKLVLEKQTDLNNVINQIKALEVLPSINSSIEASIENILTLTDNLKMSQSTLEARIERVQNTARSVLGKNQEFTVYQLASEVVTKEESVGQIQQELFFLRSTIATLNENMNTTLDQINEQYNIIVDEINKYQKRAQSFIWIVLLFVFTIPLIIALFIANVIAGRVRRIDIGISNMKEGNLSDRIYVKSRDEMGRLSKNVNDFTDKLSLSIQKIKETSKTNLELKDTLISSVQKVSETTEQVNDSIQSISSGMTKLDGTVQTTGNAVNTVENHLSTLDTVQQEQIYMVEETNASITEMITSVSSVTEITQRKKAALTNLVQVSREGGAKLEETNKEIEKIYSNLSEIQNTAAIIQNIADSTNLLAMNASIEAAHAGDSGKGFAVVASEIRKLAEATSQNSNVINKIMDGLTANIKDAVNAGTSTQKAFESIDKEVLETNDSFDEIASNMIELRTGGMQILKSMSRLNDMSSQVKNATTAMWNASGENKVSIGNVEKISGTTAHKVQDIIQALSELIKEMKTVTQVTHQAEDISRTLEDETAFFLINESNGSD